MGRVQRHRCLDRHKMCHHLSKTSATLMSRQRTYEPLRTSDQKGRCPASELVISGLKAIKQKLLSRTSFDTSFLTKLMRFTDTREAWRTGTFNIPANSTLFHIPGPSTRLGLPTFKIRYFIRRSTSNHEFTGRGKRQSLLRILRLRLSRTLL